MVVNSRGQWGDVDCTEKHAFICEKGPSKTVFVCILIYVVSLGSRHTDVYQLTCAQKVFNSCEDLLGGFHLLPKGKDHCKRKALVKASGFFIFI